MTYVYDDGCCPHGALHECAPCPPAAPLPASGLREALLALDEAWGSFDDRDDPVLPEQSFKVPGPVQRFLAIARTALAASVPAPLVKGPPPDFGEQWDAKGDAFTRKVAGSEPAPPLICSACGVLCGEREWIRHCAWHEGVGGTQPSLIESAYAAGEGEQE